jgi:hypothetical protein
MAQRRREAGNAAAESGDPSTVGNEGVNRRRQSAVLVRQALFATLLATGVCVLGVVSAVAGTTRRDPAPPPLPPIPKVPPTIPGEQIVKFKLVFEGTLHADRIADVAGRVGPGCAAQLHEDIQESTTFGRGKGVVMEFFRIKEGNKYLYGFQRAGRTGDSSFNVVAKITRTTSGSADIVQDTTTPQLPCAAIQHFDLSQNADCGKTITDNWAWGLKVTNDHVRPVPKLSSATSPDRCGDPPSGSAFQGGPEGDLTYSWPTPAHLPFTPIPIAKIFNRRYKGVQSRLQVVAARDEVTDGSYIGLSFSTDDHGSAEATIRFIRE